MWKWFTKQETENKALSGKADLATSVRPRIAQQVRIAQEAAISKRILTSEYVHIVEEYGNVADGSIGLQAENGDLHLGARKSDQRLAKREITFGGHRHH